MPQQARTLLAIALSMAVIYFYFNYVLVPPEKNNTTSSLMQTPDLQNQNQKNQNQNVNQTSSTHHETKNLGMSDNVNQSLSSVVPIINQNDQNDKTTSLVIENEHFKATLSSKGAVFTGWKLKNYRETTEKDSPSIDLLNQEAGGQALSLTLNYPDFDTQPVYQVVEENPYRIVLSKNFDGLIVEKTFEFSKENPMTLDIIVKIINKTDKSFQLEPRLWMSRFQKEEAKKEGLLSYLMPQDILNPVYFMDGEMTTEADWKKMPALQNKMGRILWTGISDRYFLLSLISRLDTPQASIQFGKTQENRIYTSLSYGSLFVKPGEETERRFSSFMGVKKRETLKALGSHLEKSVDYGWFSFVAIPILHFLMMIQKVVINWGLAIIVLTFIIKLLLHPINKKSVQSMKAMQKVQPQLKELRDKFKDDKQRLNQEMMSLFKTHKVNPMGGCLPMLLQMPIYIALYQVLWNAIELYHTPFFGFYKDLSAPDPYMITPILVGLLFMLQQKVTPQAVTMDPAQQKIMMLMPLMFSVIMIFFPFGLVLYILVNTIMTVIQHYMIHEDLTFLGLLKKMQTKLVKVS